MHNFIQFLIASVYNFASVLLVMLIIHKIVTLVSNLDRHSWTGFGKRLRFVMLSVSLALVAGGAVGVLFSFPWGGEALLWGCGGRFLFDRRLLEMNRSVLLKRFR